MNVRINMHQNANTAVAECHGNPKQPIQKNQNCLRIEMGRFGNRTRVFYGFATCSFRKNLK